MKNKIPNSLPKIEPLPGAMCLQKVKCGKPNCRCANGLLHEGYYYHFYYAGGKLLKKYVKKADVEQVRQACNAWREADRAKATILRSPEAEKVRREIRQRLRSAGATEKTIRRLTSR